MRFATIALFALIGLALLAPAARAADAEEAKALADAIEAQRKAKDPGGMMIEMEKVPPVFNEIEDKSARGKLLGAVGKIARDRKAGEARATAVVVLSQLNDPKGAWKQLSKLLPSHKVKEATKLDLAVVKAAGDLAPDRAKKPLLELLGKAKDAKLSAEAALALGGYRKDERGRVKILEEMIDTGKRIRPGNSKDQNASAEAIARWTEIGGALAKGLNRLTGQELGTFEEWEVIYKENKRRPQEIFLPDEEEEKEADEG